MSFKEILGKSNPLNKYWKISQVCLISFYKSREKSRVLWGNIANLDYIYTTFKREPLSKASMASSNGTFLNKKSCQNSPAGSVEG